MAMADDNRKTRIPGERIDPAGWAIAGAVVLAAVIARLPALGAWWNQDDWGLLARAAGQIPPPDVTIRWLSQSAYWQLMWPLAGLEPVPYAATRILLHALAAAGVVRLACRLGLAPAQQWLAGLIMAATPLAFSPLYWAAGVQDLLAVVLMVWSLERWLAAGRIDNVWAALMAIGAVTAKETVAGLPVLLLWLLWFGSRPANDPGEPDAPSRRAIRPFTLLLVGLVTAAAIGAALQALRFFATGPDDPYALGDVVVAVSRLVTYGLWLVLPGPGYPPSPGLALALLGGLVWLVWGGWAGHQWRRGRPVPLFSFLGALLMLAPLLPLTRHLAPDLAYPVEPFGCLALASLWPRRMPLRWPIALGLVVLAIGWGYLGMQGRLALRDAHGQIADPLVRRTAISADACRFMRQLPLGERSLILLQTPLTRQAAAIAERLGEDWVTGSLLHRSLSGAVGPRLLLTEATGREPDVRWVNGLRQTPEDAFILRDAGERLLPWGDTRQALLYQTMTDVGLGHFARARLHLLRVSLISGQVLSIAFEPELLPIGEERILTNLPAFHAFLARDHGTGADAVDADGLQTNILRLVSVCTGRPLAELEDLVGPAADRPEIRE